MARQIYDAAAAQIGRKAAASVSKANLAKMAKIIKSHPGYPALMREIEEVPRALLPINERFPDIDDPPVEYDPFAATGVPLQDGDNTFAQDDDGRPFFDYAAAESFLA